MFTLGPDPPIRRSADPPVRPPIATLASPRGIVAKLKLGLRCRCRQRASGAVEGGSLVLSQVPYRYEMSDSRCMLHAIRNAEDGSCAGVIMGDYGELVAAATVSDVIVVPLTTERMAFTRR